MRRLILVVLSGCATHAAPATMAPTTPATTPTTPAAATMAAPEPIKPACASAEHRQLDFWVGDWDVTIRARSSPDSDQWGEGTGHQRVDSILGGCAISENFIADGAQGPWAGRSYSSYQPTIGKWRQTWVDDSGGYLAFTGGLENGVMTLYGEPRTVKGVSFQMRMVYQDVTTDSLHWEWQRSTDDWHTNSVMMAIDYKRRR